ncbi:MAG: glucose-6-phosphate dehydrogenase [Bradymonadia bacterium]
MHSGTRDSEAPPLTQIVIFGASGDLTARKLIPALVANAMEDAFPGPIQILGNARRPKHSQDWRDELAQWLTPEQKEKWPEIAPQVHYLPGDLLKEGSEPLEAWLDTLADEAGADPAEVGRLFYLALKPSLFEPVVAILSKGGLLSCERGAERGWRRVVVEKPFGTDLASAQALNTALLRHLREDQILRIDHYLGKETVQNILSFRFQNAIFEPLWNRQHVESVEISVCETVGMEGGRGGYYDGAGALRDMVQNHLLQILALVAMEPPPSMAADAVRNEKVKVLSSLAIPSPEQVSEHVVRAQFSATESEPGYLESEGVPEGSVTETYVAIKAFIDNWRWSGVPFMLRTGKRLHRRFSEVVLRFRTPPVDLLQGPTPGATCHLRPNALRVLIQPEEGFRLQFLVKQPGARTVMRPATLGFDYRDLEAGPSAPAYQRLLLDAIEGNATLFIRGDEVEAAWRFADAIRAGWHAEPAPPVHTYPAGSTGPEAADELMWSAGGTWSSGEVND